MKPNTPIIDPEPTYNRLDKYIQKYDPAYVIALFSGGRDSTVSTHIASQHPRFSFALKIATGIGVPDTNDYVRQMTSNWGIELREYRAVDYIRADGEPDPQVYRDLVNRWGFPGPAGHGVMFQRLKERPLRHCLRELGLKRGQRVFLISGCRRDESARRMANTEEFQKWEGQKYFVAPIWDWSALNTREYMDAHDIRANPVSQLIHKSGECLCGAFAQQGELEELRTWFPEVAAEIDEIEAGAREAGFPWGWEEGPPSWFTQHRQGQGFLPGMIPEGVLCSSCISGHSDTKEPEAS